MESSGRKRPVMGRWLLVLFLAAVGLAAWGQLSSPFAQILTRRPNANVYLLVLAKPNVLIQYNPRAKKALVKEAPCKHCDRATAPDLHLPDNAVVRRYTPFQFDKDVVWDRFKHRLETWRYNPFLLVPLPYHYIAAYLSGRTDLSPAEAALAALEITKLEINDFTVKITPFTKRKKAPEPDAILPPVEDKAPLAVEDRPIVVEILNASGKKGLALALTQYLREQNNKGLLRVDVLQYDNYPGGKLKETRVVDYSGRRIQVKQLSSAIGVRREITTEPRGTAICDTRIILGQDFEMP